MSRDRGVFNHTAISLWEEDISELRAMVREWQARGIGDLRAFLSTNPGVLEKAIRAIKVVDVNEATLRLYETQDKATLLGPLQVGLGAETIPLMEYVIAIAEGRKEFEIDGATMIKGRRLDLFVTAAIPAEGDEYPHALVSILDISERKRLQRELEDEKALLRAVIDNIPDQVFLKDGEGKFVLANQALANWAGATDPSELVGKTDLDFFPSEVAQKYRQDDQAVLASGKAQPSIEEQIGSGSGSLRWALTTKVPVRDRDGAVFGVVGIVRDITERKRFEEALRESEERYRSVFMEAPVGIFHSTQEGKLVNVNPAFARILGYDSPAQIIEEVNRKNIAEVLFENPRGRSALIADLLTEAGWHRVEIRYRHKKGGVVVARAMVRSHMLSDATARDLEGFVEDVTEQKHVEQDLARERSLFNTLMENLPDFMFFKDRAGRFMRVSRSCARLFGLQDPSEAVGKTDADFFIAEYALEALEEEQRVMKSGTSLVDIEERAILPDRPDMWVILTRMPLRDSEGSIVGTFGISRDVTERKKLEARNQYLAAIVDTSNDAIVAMDRDGKVTEWNTAAELLFGFTAEEMTGVSALPLIPPELREEMSALRERLMRGERIPHIETTRLRKDGSRISVSLAATATREPEGVFTGMATASRDISERKKLEAKNQELATIVNSSGDAIIGTDLNRRITAWNKGAERIYGYLAEEMIGTTISSLIPPEYEKETQNARERAMQGEQVTNFETVRLRKDGSKIAVDMSLSAIRDSEGKIVGMASTARDITEQKALRQQLTRAQRLEGLATLAGGVAHQFNNINTVISGYLEIVRSDAGLPPRLLSHLQRAAVGVQRAMDITDRLLVLAEPGSAVSEAAQLDKLAKTILSAHAERIEKENVQLLLDIADTPPVKGDESRLKFVLSSLLGNALDSLIDRPVRTVKVSTGALKDSAFFEVEDSGCGIPERDLQKIFSPFSTMKGEWASPGSPQARVKGVGLSLAISNTMITELGGTIQVQSTEGVGSNFRLVMPLYPQRRLNG